MRTSAFDPVGFAPVTMLVDHATKGRLCINASDFDGAIHTAVDSVLTEDPDLVAMRTRLVAAAEQDAVRKPSCGSDFHE